MATIFQKTVSDECAILDSRELSVEPFNIGTDWSEIRLSMAVSFTTVTGGDNSLVSPETINYNTQRNGFYLGFKNSGQQFVLESGAAFLGASTAGRQAYFMQGGGLSTIGNDSSPAIRFLASNNTTTILNQVMAGDKPYFQMPWTVDTMTGTTAYAAINGIRLAINANTFSGSVFSSISDVNQPGTNDVSIANLRSTAINLSFLSNGATGFWTSDGTITGTTLNKPDSIFIYMPFLNTRIRIHSWIIEKYA